MKLHFVAFASVLCLAAPAQGAVSQVKAERTAPRTVTVTWAAAGPVDVYVADQPDADIRQARLVSGADRDGRAEITAESEAARPYLLLRDEADGRVARVAERLLPLDQGSNFRDLGGYPAAGGKTVRWGRIFRSGGTPLLTEQDLAKIGALHLGSMVDLRSSEERVLAPTRISGVRYSAVGYSMGQLMGEAVMDRPDALRPGAARLDSAYRRMPTLLAPQLRIVFDDLLEGHAPVAYNCSAGQDRTGFVTAMVLSALGVPRQVIVADYQLSTTYRRPEWEVPPIDEATAAHNPAAAMFARFQKDPAARKPKPLVYPDGQPMLQAAFSEVEAKWGSVEAYLQREVGVGPAELEKLKAMYLE